MLVTPQGFASIGPKAQGAPVALLRTRPLVFSGKGTAPTLFINAVGAENISFAVLDPITGQPLDGLDHHSYTGGVQGVSDSERLEVRWASHVGPELTALSKVQDKRIVLEVRFSDVASRLYSFWFASDRCGASNGWVAAGGIGFNASRDTVGLRHADPTCDASEDSGEYK